MSQRVDRMRDNLNIADSGEDNSLEFQRLFRVAPDKRDEAYASAAFVVEEIKLRNAVEPRSGAWTAHSALRLDRPFAADRRRMGLACEPLRIDGLHSLSLVTDSFADTHHFLVNDCAKTLLKIAVDPSDPNTFAFHYGAGRHAERGIITVLARPSGSGARRRTGPVGRVELVLPEDRADDPRPDPALALSEGSQNEILPWRIALRRTFEDASKFQSRIASVRLDVRRIDPIARLLTRCLMLEEDRPERSEVERRIFVGEQTAFPFQIDVTARGGECPPAAAGGRPPHITFAVPTLPMLAAFQEELQVNGFRPGKIVDRTYWISLLVPVEEVLIELAVHVPGFTVDERREQLGSALRLPAHLECDRKRYERRLREVTGAALD